VRVVLRCRPLSQQEILNDRRNVVSIDAGRRVVALQPARPGDPLREFSFDAVFGQDATQAQVTTGRRINLLKYVTVLKLIRLMRMLCGIVYYTIVCIPHNVE
jgi:hypothetical protein